MAVTEFRRGLSDAGGGWKLMLCWLSPLASLSSSTAVALGLFAKSAEPPPEIELARPRANVLEDNGRGSFALLLSNFSCLVDHTNAFDLYPGHSTFFLPHW